MSVSPRPAGVFGAPPRLPSSPGLPGWAHSLGFARDGSGFALLADCVSEPAAPESGFCRQHVAVRDAGAKEWVLRRSPLPETRGTEGISANLLALGPGRALVEDGGGEPGARTWFTRDGGRSWRVGDRRTVGTIPEIPAGAVLTTDCAEPAGAGPDLCDRQRLVVVSPQDGRRRALARVPLLGAHPRPAEQPEPDGSWWVSGTDPLSGRAAVAVSRDAGRSWTVSRLPSPAAGPGRHTAVAVGRDAVYAAELGELTGGEPVKNPMRALHRSVDGGRTWQRMWTTGREREPRTLLGLPVPGPGGRVEIGGELSGYGSVDGGRTFVRLGDGGHFIRRTPLGLLREQAPCQYALTVDGVRWSEFRLACGDEVF
ncbi:sialidase family protein [Streptomyces sp. NBC_00094]|uniref:sialidase family protein n=1 Tax=Streptomyces sp. NBC_00094 TaxID=2903620 RepID=UPI00224C828A|nr:sialidase family protein [Streptomyces sp. NBC_00094]MCX5391499.1 glycoside hydrolase [Streptomyces sp. NBC_00094]